MKGQEGMLDVAAFLSELDEGSQAALFNALAYKRQVEVVQGPTRLQQDYWSALCEALDIPRSRHPALGPFLASYGRARFDERVDELEKYIDRSCGELMRAPQRQAVRVQVLKSIVSYLHRCDVVCSPKAVINASAMRLGEAVDQAFPGYARAGLLHRVAPLARKQEERAA